MTDKARPAVSEMFDQAMKNYEQVLRTGLKVQEETGKWCINLVNQSGRAGFDLMKQGMETTHTASVADTQNRWVDYCEQSLKSLRSNAEAVADINARAIDSWIDLVKKTSAEIVEPKTAKA